jgi:hypothetical protein
VRLKIKGNKPLRKPWAALRHMDGSWADEGWLDVLDDDLGKPSNWKPPWEIVAPRA